LPEDFNDVVEVVANEYREQNQNITDICVQGATPEEVKEAMRELMELNEGNQFW